MYMRSSRYRPPVRRVLPRAPRARLLSTDQDNNNVAVIGATPQQFRLDANIVGLAGVASMDGITIRRSRLVITAIPVTAPGAALNDTLYCGVMKESQQLTAAQMDISSQAFRVAYRWGYLEPIYQTPLIAANPANAAVNPARHVASFRLGRFVGTTDVPWLVLASAGTMTWRINWYIRHWFTLP